MRTMLLAAAGVSLLFGVASCRDDDRTPQELKSLISSAPDEESAKLLNRCVDEWWPVLSGDKPAPLHVVMNVDYIVPDIRARYPESADLPDAFPEGQYRVARRFEIWQEPPLRERVEGPFAGVEMRAWISPERRVVFLPDAGFHKDREDPSLTPSAGLGAQLSVVVEKIRTAAKLGSLRVVRSAPDEGTVRFDIGVVHGEKIDAASPVPPLVRLWIDRTTAMPVRAVFFGGEADLKVAFHTIEKDTPVPENVFKPPEDLGEEATDEEFITELLGGAFGGPDGLISDDQPTRESRIDRTRTKIAFWMEVLFAETALESIPSGQAENSDGETSTGYDREGIFIEIHKGEAWKDVTITINADLGPEAYAAHIDEVTPGERVVVPFSDFKNAQGYSYRPVNFRFGRTTIDAAGERKQGITWENCI